jgi:hypothetical protein
MCHPPRDGWVGRLQGISCGHVRLRGGAVEVATTRLSSGMCPCARARTIGTHTSANGLLSTFDVHAGCSSIQVLAFFLC